MDTCCNFQSNQEKNYARMYNYQANWGKITDDQFIQLLLINTSVYVYASSAVHSAFAVGLLNANIIGLSLISAMALSTSAVKSRPAPATPVINKAENSNFITGKIKQFLSTAFLE